MSGFKVYFFLTVFGLQALGRHVYAASPSPPCGLGQCSTSDKVTPATSMDPPRVEKVMFQKCNSSMETYCFNKGECMFLPDLNEHHCRCERGYVGARCGILEMVYQPVIQEHIILTVVCVGLTVIGVLGAACFFYKWHRKNRCPPKDKYHQGVQMV